MNKMFAIIEIGSNNTKTHIYKNEELIYEKTDTSDYSLFPYFHLSIYFH